MLKLNVLEFEMVFLSNLGPMQSPSTVECVSVCVEKVKVGEGLTGCSFVACIKCCSVKSLVG